jgi:hypothetical protein
MRNGKSAIGSAIMTRWLAHITLDVRVAIRDQLDRLAWHFDWSLTQ